MTGEENQSIFRAMQSNKEIIQAIGRRNIATELEIPEERVRGWERIDSLPAEYWKEILAMAPLYNVELSAALLIRIAARPQTVSAGA